MNKKQYALLWASDIRRLSYFKNEIWTKCTLMNQLIKSGFVKKGKIYRSYGPPINI